MKFISNIWSKSLKSKSAGGQWENISYMLKNISNQVFQSCLVIQKRFHISGLYRTVRVPPSLLGTYAKIRPKSPQIGGRKIQKVTSIKYIVNKYIIIYYYILLYITLQYYYILLLYIIYNYYIIIIIIWCFELTFGPSESGN